MTQCLRQAGESGDGFLHWFSLAIWKDIRMDGPKITDLISEEQPVEPPQGPVPASDTPHDEIPPHHMWTRMITSESVSTVRSRGRAATREPLTSHPSMLYGEVGVCRVGYSHGAVRQAGGGPPSWQEKEVTRRKVAKRSPSALSVKCPSVLGTVNGSTICNCL